MQTISQQAIWYAAIKQSTDQTIKQSRNQRTSEQAMQQQAIKQSSNQTVKQSRNQAISSKINEAI